MNLHQSAFEQKPSCSKLYTSTVFTAQVCRTTLSSLCRSVVPPCLRCAGLSYHPEQTICWSDRSQGRIYRQSLSSSLGGSVDDIDELLYIRQAALAAVALDHVAGNVYFSELSAPFIGQ